MNLHLCFFVFILVAETIAAADLRVPFNKFRKENQYTDCKIILENGKEFPCHRPILALASDYFHKMFSSGMLEGKYREIRLPLSYEEAVETLLNIIYEPNKNIDLPINIWSYVELKEYTQSLLSDELIKAVATLEIKVPPEELDRAIDYIAFYKDQGLAEKIGFVRDKALGLDKACYKIKAQADWLYKNHFNADRTRKVAISGQTIQLLNTIDDSVILSLSGVNKDIEAVACSPDGKQIVILVHWAATLWDISAGTAVTLKNPSSNASGFNNVEFNRDGTFLIMCHSFGIALFNAPNGQLINFIPTETRPISSSFSSDGKRIISILEFADKPCCIHNVLDGSLIAAFSCTNPPWTASFNPEGDKILILNCRSFSVYDIVNNKEVITIDNAGDITCAVFTPDGKCIETASRQGVMQEWVYPLELLYNTDILLKDPNAKHWLLIRHQFALYRNGQSREESMKKTKKSMEKLIPFHGLLLSYYKTLFDPFTIADDAILPFQVEPCS